MNTKWRIPFWIVFLVAVITLLPFLGNTDFTTKGEPREAVVALSMLNQHNWILPTNNGVDIPYKPPFFQWCIALFSLPFGHITAYTSRLPSAIALIIMLSWGAAFYARRKNSQVSVLAAVLTLTAFEVHRAGTNCRVDMVLTLFIVGALYQLYRWWEHDCHQLPWWAILAMSAATLTKGPVGIVLPCFVMTVFMTVMTWRQQGSYKSLALRLVGKLLPAAILACVLPALWYWAAYQQGGENFLWLVMDENFGRFMGKMAHVTHANGWYYNLLTLITGWLPWTLPVVLSLFVLPWKQFSRQHFADSVRKADALQVFTWLAFLLILIFYCIPKSKRSVYLLPCYPFMAVLLAEYLVWLAKRSYAPIRIYIGLLCTIGIVLTGLLVALRAGAVPDTLFHGRHAADNIAIVHALAYQPLSVADICWISMPLIGCCIGLLCLLHRRVAAVTERPVLASLTMTLLLFLAFDGYYKPTIMNTKSFEPFAMRIGRLAAYEPLYAYTGPTERGDDALRFYGTDFFLNDRIRQFDRDLPTSGLVMVPASKVSLLKDTYTVNAPSARHYEFKEIYHSARRETEFKDTIYVFRFHKDSPTPARRGARLPPPNGEG